MWVRACFSLVLSSWLLSLLFSVDSFKVFLCVKVAFHRHLTIVSNIWPIVWQPNHVGLSSTINCLRDNNNFFSLCDVGSIVGIIMYFFHLLDSNWNIFSKSTSEKKEIPLYDDCFYRWDCIHVFGNSCNIQSCLTAMHKYISIQLMTKDYFMRQKKHPK